MTVFLILPHETLWQLKLKDKIIIFKSKVGSLS